MKVKEILMDSAHNFSFQTSLLPEHAAMMEKVWQRIQRQRQAQRERGDERRGRGRSGETEQETEKKKKKLIDYHARLRERGKQICRELKTFLGCSSLENGTAFFLNVRQKRNKKRIPSKRDFVDGREFERPAMKRA